MDGERRLRLGRALGGARIRTLASSYQELSELRREAGLPPERGEGKGRHVAYLTQEELDLLAGLKLGSNYYKRLEKGRITAPPEQILRKFGHLLRLEEHRWNEVWLALYGQMAPRPLNPSTALAKLWKDVVDRPQELAVYISHLGWDVLHYNEQAAALFGTMPTNIMRWMLSLAPFEDSLAKMPNWLEVWVPRALSQLRAALDEYPRNAVLLQLKCEVMSLFQPQADVAR